MKDKQLLSEYAGGTANIQHCIRQHASFCMYAYFDQVRRTDAVDVQCCACGKTFKVAYDKIATDMYCNDCIDVMTTKEHIARLQDRLATIQRKLTSI